MTLAIDQRARHYPNRTALIDHTDDVRVSYGELSERADVAAYRLESMGITAGDAVAVLARNRIEYLSLLWATRRLDVTLSPISHRLPASTVGELTERIEPRIVLIEPRFEELTDEVDAPVDTVEAIDVTADEIDSPRTAEVQRAPAMYLHTGGTTGIPKVVEISERQLEWNAITEVAAWGLGKNEVCPVLLPLFHTGGWNLLTLPTLYVGGRVIIQREFDPGEVLDLIQTYGATRLFGVAAIFQALADHDRFEDTDLSSLEWCMSGGGPTPTSVMDIYRQRGVPFTQGYGLTEGGPNNLYFDPDRPDSDKSNESVGRPFPDCQARIVDEKGHEVEPGTIGELELSGPVIAAGYLETEDGTFDGDWVSTGDLAIIDKTGDITIEGRVDNMFVSGGENVYPEEIEGVLERHDGVARAGVIPVEHERWGKVPVAVIQPIEGADFPIDEVESLATEALPGYAVPRSFTMVDDLPLSGPGKLDREALGALI